MLTEVLKNIEQRNRFMLTSHVRPDGDAIGSVLACSMLLRKLGKQAEVVLSDGVPFIYRCLPEADSVIRASSVNGSYEAAIVLECDSIERTRLAGLEEQFLINIDHHATSTRFAHVNWIEPDACATAELVFKLAREARVTICPDMATCLYTAVLTDTGAFSFVGTDERTFAVAKELVHCGADPVRIAQNVYYSQPAAKMRLLGAALSGLHRDGNLVWMAVSRDQMERCAASDEDTEGLVNYALSIQGVEVAFFFREQSDGRYRVSLRSKGKLNVAKVAEHFGGGGHTCASGFNVEGPLSVASERILAQLRIAGWKAENQGPVRNLRHCH
jgi:phosphoesterase RecJ-like protein